MFNRGCSRNEEYPSFHAGAVYRFYESRRRIFNDNKPERREDAVRIRTKARKKEPRERVGLFLFNING